MFSIKIHITYIIFLNIAAQIQTLEELPRAEDNIISTAEKALRNTLNNLFSSFGVQGVMQISRLKQFSTIHSFFVSITLTDCDNLKEIARLTRVDNIDNITQNFITQVNEVLNEGDKSNEATDDVYITTYIETFIKKLKYLKDTYTSNNTDINEDILKLISSNREALLNVSDETNISQSNDSNENILGDDEFWTPSSRRLFQGYRTRIKHFPFMASIQFFKKFQCAGSIIKNDLVITSSSCLQLAWNNRFFRENPAFLSVQIGCDYYEGDGENIAVLEVYFHPEYDPRSLKNNLAIMRLTRRISFKRTHKRVKKIDIDRNPWQMPDNTGRITVVGWGAKDSSNIIYDVFRNKLSYSQLDFYLLKDCQDHYSKEFVTRKNFCAGFMSHGGGACNRDAGGPGIVRGKLMGVISFGSTICGSPDAPTVFTKLGFYTDWIEDIMEQDIPSTYKRTTQRPLSGFPTYSKKRTPMRITPLITTRSPIPMAEIDTLRIAQDIGFKDFLATVFGSEEVKEYFDKTGSGGMIKINEDESFSTNKKKRQVTAEKATEESDTNKSAEKSKLEKLRKLSMGRNLKKKSKINASKGKHNSMQLVDSSSEAKNTERVTRIDIFDTATEPEKKLTVTENDSVDDKTLENDIMTLIDNLDIDKLLSYVKPSSDSKQSNRKGYKKQYSSESSSEASDDISPNQQSVLNFLFLSAEKDDEHDGLSIPVEPFKDLTFRDRANNTKEHDVLSNAAMYDLVSLAINEEAKRIRKNNKKRYLLK